MYFFQYFSCIEKKAMASKYWKAENDAFCFELRDALVWSTLSFWDFRSSVMIFGDMNVMLLSLLCCNIRKLYPLPYDTVKHRVCRVI